MIEDRSYGVILILREGGVEDKFLLLHQRNGHWSFPKGHKEGEETPKETAFRELKEEASITDFTLSDLPTISEEYTYVDPDSKETYHKIVEYFILFAKDDKVTIQDREILDYKWATFTESLKLFTFPESKRIISEVNEKLTNMVK